jgi:hypothetical protein
MYLCVNKSLKTAGISAATSHILTVPFITALEQLREVRGFTHRGRKNIQWKAANAGHAHKSVKYDKMVPMFLVRIVRPLRYAFWFLRHRSS